MSKPFYEHVESAPAGYERYAAKVMFSGHADGVDLTIKIAGDVASITIPFEDLPKLASDLIHQFIHREQP